MSWRVGKGDPRVAAVLQRDSTQRSAEQHESGGRLRAATANLLPL